MFNNEIALILPKEVKKDIINLISKNNWYKNKKITIEYIFRVNFSRINEFDYYYTNNLLGIIFFKNELFFINNRLEQKIHIYNKRDKNSKNKLLSLLGYINEKNKNIIDIDENLYKSYDSSTKKLTYSNLLEYNKNRPSDIFIFSILEIN